MCECRVVRLCEQAADYKMSPSLILMGVNHYNTVVGSARCRFWKKQFYF